MSSTYLPYEVLSSATAPEYTVPITEGTCQPKGTKFGGWTVPALSDVEPITYTATRVSETRSPPDPSSWTAKKRSGRVHMSPYGRSKTTVQDYVAGRELVQWRHLYNWCSTSRECKWAYDSGLRIGRYREQRHFDAWFDAYPWLSVFHSTYIDQGDIATAINATRSEAVRDALSGYDLLTELAELPEAIKFVQASTSSIAGFLASTFAEATPQQRRRAFRMTPKAMLHSTDKVLQHIGAKWMAYRYAVMPIVYSYREISQMLSEKETLFRTFRAKRTVLPKIRVPHNPSSLYIRKDTSGQVTVRSTVKMGFTAASVSSASRVSFNPFVTAWELTTLSFVVDWFLNVGDFIVAHTAVDLSGTSGYCTSVKTETVDTYVLVSDSKVVIPPLTAGSGPCGLPPSRPGQTIANSAEELLRVVTTESYNRTLFTRTDVNLGFQTDFLNWKRSLDSAVLGYSKAKQILRKLF